MSSLDHKLYSIYTYTYVYRVSRGDLKSDDCDWTICRRMNYCATSEYNRETIQVLIFPICVTFFSITLEDNLQNYTLVRKRNR